MYIAADKRFFTVVVMDEHRPTMLEHSPRKFVLIDNRLPIFHQIPSHCRYVDLLLISRLVRQNAEVRWRPSRAVLFHHNRRVTTACHGKQTSSNSVSSDAAWTAFHLSTFLVSIPPAWKSANSLPVF